jgi:putative peptide zinc metalloprotease protein
MRGPSRVPADPERSAGPSRALDNEIVQRAAGLQLIGDMKGSGYRIPPFLVRRIDGQTLQLTRLLYLTLEAIDGQRDLEQVASVVSDRFGRVVTADNVRALLDDKLRPLGLVTKADGSQPELKRSNPLLGLHFRVAVTDEATTQRLTAPFALLFRPVVAVPVLAAFALVCWWVFFQKGLASATYEAFQHPGLLIFVFVVTILSAGFHEFGHAAAARYGGARPGVMGAGFYLAWPAFYTDVTDSYRLGRGGRLRTDLGGLYFNAIVAVAITATWWATGYDALLLVVATQILQMIGQLVPLVRFDGYHVLADLTGVPDLFRRIKPTLLGALPWRWGDREARLLKPWARIVVTSWVIVVVPVLLFTLYLMVLTLPRVLATAWAKLALEQDTLAAAWGDGDLLQATARLLTMLAVVIPVLAVLLMLGRLVRRLCVGVWRRTEGRRVQRSLAVVVGCGLLAALVWAWWPDGRTYRPIEPHERGTLANAFQADAARAPTAPAAGLVEGGRGDLVVGWDFSRPLPTEDDPQLALVLVPKDPASSTEPAQGWVFPFDQPLAPGPADNQALAVNTEDGTVEYDVAISLVWATDDDPVLNVNEAYAFASCTSCASVAVAFQVVLILGDNDTVVTQNLAGALNSDCVNCLTYALAQQLIVTLDGPLSQEARDQLDALWQDLAEFAEDIESYPLSEIDDRLDQYAEEILAIIEEDQPGTVPAPATSSAPPSVEPSPTESPAASPTESPGASPTQSPTEIVSPTEPVSSPSPAESTPLEPTTTEPTPSP